MYRWFCPHARWNVRNTPHLVQNRGVPIWKPHSLSQPHADQIDLKLGDRVRATGEIDRPTIGVVPDGTEGHILLANGFNWQRYRVLFDNGVEIETSIIGILHRLGVLLVELPNAAPDTLSISR